MSTVSPPTRFVRILGVGIMAGGAALIFLSGLGILALFVGVVAIMIGVGLAFPSRSRTGVDGTDSGHWESRAGNDGGSADDQWPRRRFNESGTTSSSTPASNDAVPSGSGRGGDSFNSSGSGSSDSGGSGSSDSSGGGSSSSSD